jgi:hypothetical protein
MIFLANLLGIAASLLLFVGAAAIFFAGAILGVGYHWACWGLLLLIPAWMAAFTRVADFASDLEYDHSLRSR